MIRSLENLAGYHISATNGSMGTVTDFFWLDDTWHIKYLVVTAGGWLDRRQVLISTDVIKAIDDARREFVVGMTRELVYSSPNVDSDKPVTRQKELLLAEHFGWKPYWIPDPFLGASLPTERLEVTGEMEGSDPHLRSFREITTYSIKATDSTAFATDVISRDDDWSVESIVAAAGRGLGERAVLCPPSWIGEINWRQRLLRISGEHPSLAFLPVFDPSAPVNRRTVVRYFDYEGKPQGSALLPENEESKTP